MYKIRLEAHFCSREGAKEKESVRLIRWIELPFAPYPGLRLGLYSDSEFNFDQEIIVRVMFNVPKYEFYVELEPKRYADFQLLRARIQDGWRLDLILLDNPNDLYLEDHDRIAIQIDGKYVAVNQSELFCLQQQGTIYTPFVPGRPDAPGS